MTPILQEGGVVTLLEDGYLVEPEPLPPKRSGCGWALLSWLVLTLRWWRG